MIRRLTRQVSLQDSKRQVSRQLVSVVNPRLAMYTRAGFLAAAILACNFAIIAGLALVLQQDCTSSTVVDRSTPVTFGDFSTYEEFMNVSLAREGVVKEGTTTTTTTVSGCVKKNSAVLVAPYMATLCTNTCMQGRYASDGECDDGGPGSEYDNDEDKESQMTSSSSCPFGTDCDDCGVRVPPPSYLGTGITTDVPCWNQFLPCFQSTSQPRPSPSTGLPDCSTIPTWCVPQCAQYAPCLTSSDPACANALANAPSQCQQCINYAHCVSQGNGRALAEERRLFFGTASPPPPDQLTCPGGGVNACPNPAWNSDGTCDDGGPGASYASCSLGTDCTDCGPRGGGGFFRSPSPPPPSPSPPPPSPSPPPPSPSPPPPSPPPPSPSPPPPSPSTTPVCTNQLNSGLTYTDGTPVPCTYFTTTPAQCASYTLAQNNCPVSCGSCQGVPSPSPPPPSPSPPPPAPSCANQINSGVTYTSGTPVPCTYFTTNPTQCASYPPALNNCPISCGTCQGLCTETCNAASDGDCDDGGPGAEFSMCAQGTDCIDCGPRALNTNGAQARPPPSISPPSSSAYGYNYGDGENEPSSSLQPSTFQVPCGWYRTSEAADVGGASYKSEMGPKADRFPWCSEEVHDVARRKYIRHRNLTSMDKSSVNLAILCGLNRMNGIPVTPGGILYPNLSPAPGENLIGTTTSFTTHWSLNVTTTKTVCPKFSAAFSSALAFATYIEIIITIVLVFVFKMCALIEDKKGVVDVVDSGRFDLATSVREADTMYPKLESLTVSAERTENI
jgi:hypothetical protein